MTQTSPPHGAKIILITLCHSHKIHLYFCTRNTSETVTYFISF